jgi:hypothetical protein
MKIQTTAAAALLGAAAGAFRAQAGDAVQWRVEDGGNGHWYQVITAQMAWPDASQYSKVRGGHLVTLASSTEKDFVWSQASPILSSQAFWIGGFQSPGACEPGCGWRWMTDEPFSYTNWTPGEPNDYRINGNEDAVCTNEVNAWNDLTSNAAIPFVIEWSADCNSDGIVDYGQCHDGTLPDYNGNNIPDCCEQGVQCTVANYPVQWRVEDGGNGHWYSLDEALRTWDAARLTAISLGGHLATIQNAAENAVVVSLSTTPPPGMNRSCWLGAQQLPGNCEPGCGWTWITREPFDFQYWASGEPNNFTGSEDYLHIWVTDQWNDTTASQTSESVIEWDADCNSDGIVDYGQVLNGTLADTNTNGVPDICEGRLTIRVPADQPTIQAAIDAAPLNTQCIVAVSAGTYAGPIDFKGKSVIVRGAGASQTVISGSAGSTLSVVRFTGGEPAFAALENVSIRGGVTGSPFPGSPQFQVGGGLFAYNSAASVRDCVFENNTAAFGGGAYVWNCTGSIQRCAFRNNSAGADGAGIQLYRGSPTVVDTIVENNTANSRGGGLHIVDGTPNLVRTIVRNNISSNNVGGVSWVPAGNAAAFLSIDGCNVTGNTAAVVQGGIGILEDGATTKVSLHGTTVCENLPRPNVAGRFIDLGGNVVCDCAGDLNLDGVVNGADLGLMLSGWGPCGSSCLYDLNVDGVVNGADLGLLLAAWGACGS